MKPFPKHKDKNTILMSAKGRQPKQGGKKIKNDKYLTSKTVNEITYEMRTLKSVSAHLIIKHFISFFIVFFKVYIFHHVHTNNV